MSFNANSTSFPILPSMRVHLSVSKSSSKTFLTASRKCSALVVQSAPTLFLESEFTVRSGVLFFIYWAVSRTVPSPPRDMARSLQHVRRVLGSLGVPYQRVYTPYQA